MYSIIVCFDHTIKFFDILIVEHNKHDLINFLYKDLLWPIYIISTHVKIKYKRPQKFKENKLLVLNRHHTLR